MRYPSKLALASLFLLPACGSQATPAEGSSPATEGTGGAVGAGASMCTAPTCASCGSCVETCYCLYQDIQSCSAQCVGVPAAGGSPGAAPSGTAPPPAGTGTGGFTPPPVDAGLGTGEPAPTGTATSPEPSATGTVTPPPMSTGAAPPPAGSQEFDITTSMFQVPAGGETYKCQNFKNPVAQDVAIVQSSSFMPKGSHHMFVFHGASYDADTNTVADCLGTEFATYVHVAQGPEVTISYPPDVGYALKGTEGLRIIAHYLNTTSSIINAAVNVKFYYVPPDQVHYLAAEMWLNDLAVTVPPGMSVTSRTFTVPYEIKMLYALPHMHSRGVHFKASTSTGQVFYDADGWNEPPPNVFDPPLDVPAGAVVTWACTYNNTSTSTLTFGESATSNEMCIFNGAFYPVQAGANQGVPLDNVF